MNVKKNCIKLIIKSSFIESFNARGKPSKAIAKPINGIGVSDEII